MPMSTCSKPSIERSESLGNCSCISKRTVLCSVSQLTAALCFWDCSLGPDSGRLLLRRLTALRTLLVVVSSTFACCLAGLLSRSEMSASN